MPTTQIDPRVAEALDDALVQEAFLTASEVSACIRYTVDDIRRLVDEGELPGFRVGKRYRISRAALIEHFARRPAV